MGQVKIDARLVAAGYDKNRNGIVSDELKIDAPIDTDGNKEVSVAELAAALGNDQIVISNGFAQARKPGQAPDMPELRIMKSIHEISGEAMTFGGPQYPAWRYQETRERSDGSTYTYYHWREAIADLRSKLSAIEAVASNQTDFRSKTIADMARNAMWQNNWSELLDDGTSRSRYAALYVAVQSINSMSKVPPQPVDSVNGMFSAVNGAKGAIDGLRNTMKDPGVVSADEKARSKASSLRQAAQSIPWWQYLLIFGFFKKMSLNNQAKKVEENLAVLKAANPDNFEGQLTDTARKAYETSQTAWNAKNIDDAQALANSAGPIQNEATGISNGASGQAKKIQDLLKTIAN